MLDLLKSQYFVVGFEVILNFISNYVLDNHLNLRSMARIKLFIKDE